MSSEKVVEDNNDKEIIDNDNDIIDKDKKANKCEPFYLNVLLYNKKELVASKVEGKLGTGIFGKLGTAIANKVVTDTKVIDQLSEQLIEKTISTISDLGIQADVSKRFQKGPFVVIRIQIYDVDTLKLILAAKGEDFVRLFSNLLGTVTALGIADSILPKIDDRIFEIMQNTMMKRFEELVPLKMAEQGLDVSVVVKTANEQAEYFFGIISQI